MVLQRNSSALDRVESACMFLKLLASVWFRAYLQEKTEIEKRF